MDEVSSHVCLDLPMARPPKRSFHLVFETHDGRAYVPIPERSTSPRVTSTPLQMDGLKALDLNGRLEKRQSLLNQNPSGRVMWAGVHHGRQQEWSCPRPKSIAPEPTECEKKATQSTDVEAKRLLQEAAIEWRKMAAQADRHVR
jgi:hypothetical protein